MPYKGITRQHQSAVYKNEVSGLQAVTTVDRKMDYFNWFVSAVESNAVRNLMIAPKEFRMRCVPFCAAMVVLVNPLSGANSANAQNPPNLETFQSIAEEAFVYGFPMVMGYSVMYEYAIDTIADQYKAPFNQIYNTARVYTPKDTAVVTPNSDTPYSFVWADLRAEPVVFQVPPVETERYYSVQLVDLYTFNYGYVGSRATGNAGGTYMIAGPNWDGDQPPSVDKIFRCETEFSFVIFRTQLFGADDLDDVKRIQSGYKVSGLSKFLKKPAPPAAEAIEWPKFDNHQSATNPFSYLSFLLQFGPMEGAAEGEKALRARFAKIGIEAGKPFPSGELTAQQTDSIAKGIQSGLGKIKQRVASIGRSENGWRLGSAAGDREFYDGDWLLRAAGAMAGIYGNSQTEAFYPFLVTDSEGNKPDGSKHKYSMTFPPGQLPPVNAFWSITIYDARTQMLVENPIDRYLINSPMVPGLQRNDDGSLTVYIQKDSPGKGKTTNWLPAPDGPIFLVMRLYWPKSEALNGGWTPPAVVPAEKSSTPMSQKIGRPRRPGDKSVENIVRTDERYGHDALFQGPRGWAYWNNLERPRQIQNPNLWPDTQSTYFIGRFNLPAGCSLTIPLEFPHARYFQFALYKNQNNTFISIGESLTGPIIEPDPGSTNPFRFGADRQDKDRNCTLQIVAKNAPASDAEREPNTMYVGKAGGLFQSVIRIYLPDHGWDGTGWGPSKSSHVGHPFRYFGSLADGTQLSTKEVIQRFAQPIQGATKPPISATQWVALVNDKDNDPALAPATAPARPKPQWEKYWGIPYSILGAFKTPKERSKIQYGGSIDGGGDPNTQYFLTHLSRKFGAVYVMRGKMPTFPDTYLGSDGRGLALMPETQTQYWSLVSCEAAPSGQIVDGLTDMQIPLDDDGNYTIVHSRAEDRPKNATFENGIAWIEWSPRGEGIDHPRNREDFGMLMLRIMATNPKWKQRPDSVTMPGMEVAVMGEYLPSGYYTDKTAFEAKGTTN